MIIEVSSEIMYNIPVFFSNFDEDDDDLILLLKHVNFSNFLN